MLRTILIVIPALVLAAPASNAQWAAVGPHHRVAVGSEPGSVALGDLNGDGFEDAVASCRASNRIGVMKFDPTTGRFGAPTYYAVGVFPQGLAIGNLKGDSAPDILVCNRTSPQSQGYCILVNDGNGDFPATPSYYDNSPSTLPRSAAIADLDNDGDRDFVIVNQGTGSADRGVTVVQNNPSGSFGTSFRFQSPYANPDQVVLADVDGNGRRDIVVTHNTSPGRIRIWFNEPAGSSQIIASNFPTAGIADVTVSGNLRGLAVRDMNHDGRLDLVVAEWTSPVGYVSVLLQTASGGFALTSRTAVGDQPLDLAVADLDGDTFLDVSVVNELSRTVSILLGRGNGHFGAELTLGVGSVPTSIAVADLVGDAARDLVVGLRGENRLAVFRGAPGALSVPGTYSVSSGLPLTVSMALGSDFTAFPYVVAVNATGGHPGELLGAGVVSPFPVDDLTRAVLHAAMTGDPMFPSFAGTLSGAGQATANFVPSSPLPPSLVGVVVRFAVATVSPSGALQLTSSTPTTLVP